MRALKQFVFLVFAASATLVLQTQTTRTQAQYSSGTCAINWPASGSESDGCATGTCTSFRLNSGNPLPTCQNLCSQPAPYGCCSGYDLPETNGCGNAGQYCTGNLTTQVYGYKVCKCTGVCGG